MTLITGALGTACTSEPTETSSAAEPAAIPPAGSSTVAGAVVHRIGKGLAKALNDPAVRAWVRAELNHSPYVESRIRFKQDLTRASVKPEVTKVLAHARLGTTQKTDIRGLPEIELYMPIREHLRSWQGDANVQVAVPINRDEEYVIYSLDGSSRRSRNDHTPATATLVLATSEIDYDDQESALKGGSRTGPMMRAAGSSRPQFSLGFSPSFGISTAQHTRLSALRVLEEHDGFLAGTDEVEVFGAMVTWFLTGQFKECTRITGVGDLLKLPNSPPDWDVYYLLNNPGRTIATAVPTVGSADKVYIHAYEDDLDGCVFRRGEDDFYGKSDRTRAGYNILSDTYRDSGARGHIQLQVIAATP
jgi:hypothetical protein